MKTKWIFGSLLAATVLFFSACTKEENIVDVTDNFEVVSQDDLEAESLVEDATDEIEAALETWDPGGVQPRECPTLTVVPANGGFPRTVTIDFGEACEGRNGRTRSGKIIVQQTDTMSNTGATRTFTFDGFAVDGAQFAGTKTVTNTGRDADGNRPFKRTVTGASITYPDGTVSSWSGEQVITQVAGANTRRLADDVFEITGGSEGTNRMGKTFSTSIVDPLVKQKTCPWLVRGSKSVSRDDKPATLAYGDGQCNQFAILTLPDGTTKEIMLHRWWRR